MPSKVWYKIIYPFPNVNGFTVEVSEDIDNFIPHFIIDVITDHARIKSNLYEFKGSLMLFGSAWNVATCYLNE